MTAKDRIKQALLEALTELKVFCAGRENDLRRWMVSDLVTDLAPLIESALEAHAAEAVLEARQEAMRDCPVSEERLTYIRSSREGGSLAIDARNIDEYSAIQDLLAVIDHLSSRIDVMTTDSGAWQDGYQAGQADASPARRYHLFAGCSYYPDGGTADYKGAFATASEAMASLPPPEQWSTHGPDAMDWAEIAEAQPAAPWSASWRRTGPDRVCTNRQAGMK